MNSLDLLRQKRDSGYSTGAAPKPEAGGRAITLAPEELEAIGEAEGPVQCLVTGTVADGKLMIESIEAPNAPAEEGAASGMMPSQNSPS